jgi:hypothetical protein
MILARAVAWVKDLPNLRGRKALLTWGGISVSLFLIAGGIALAYYRFFAGPQINPVGSQSSVSASPKPPVDARDIPGPINGSLFTASESATWKNRTPLAVIIENHLDSRPQSGLGSADLVYEALAEGGITRQMGIFLTNLSDVNIGPIRSMRVYFLDWLEEYSALAAHVGGNVHALARIIPEHVKDLDQFYNSASYLRTTDRFAPHNVYSSIAKLWSLGTSKSYTGFQNFHSYTFKDEASATSRPAAQKISLSFLGDINYQVVWTYVPADNAYLRVVGGVPAIDRNLNKQIEAKTVIVQVIPYTFFTGDEKGALNMQDIGSGKAYVFEDGLTTNATWSKVDRTSRTIFNDAAGKEIPLNRGQIWIEAVPPVSTVNASN